jgi:glycosyltransferase involved in cell wall biosynthesis
MYRNHYIGVVVPAYNEEGLVGNVIRDMPEYVDRIYVVDDRSTDGTWDEIVTAARADASSTIAVTVGETITNGVRIEDRGAVHEQIGRVVPIRHRENRGAGGAIKTGYLAALSDEMDVTVTVDGDGQMDPNQMTRLIDPIVDGQADYAKGNRLFSRNTRETMPTWRFLGNTILTYLTRIASGYWRITDPQNGYTAISYRTLESAEIKGLYEYYGYCNDLLVTLNVNGANVADVAMPTIYGDEDSSIIYTTYIPKVSGMLLRNFLWRLEETNSARELRPLAPLYYLGGCAMTIGILDGVRLQIARIIGGPEGNRPESATTTFLVGWLFVLFAILLDLTHNEGEVIRIYE